MYVHVLTRTLSEGLDRKTGGRTGRYTDGRGVYTAVMTKRLIDVDDQALDAARAQLGTATIKDTVNEALRLAGTERRRDLDAAINVLSRARLRDRTAGWR
jgi:Arc/MetJ family transcription regulator